MKRLKHIFALLFWKSAFVKAEHEHSGLDTEEAERRVARKQTGYAVSFGYVVGALGAGYVMANLLNDYLSISWDTIRGLRAVSMVIFGWIVLSRFGYEDETWKGQTLLEITSRKSFKFFYVIGLFLVSMALFLDAE